MKVGRSQVLALSLVDVDQVLVVVQLAQDQVPLALFELVGNHADGVWRLARCGQHVDIRVLPVVANQISQELDVKHREISLFFVEVALEFSNAPSIVGTYLIYQVILDNF